MVHGSKLNFYCEKTDINQIQASEFGSIRFQWNQLSYEKVPVILSILLILCRYSHSFRSGPHQLPRFLPPPIAFTPFYSVEKKTSGNGNISQYLVIAGYIVAVHYLLKVGCRRVGFA
jgi:hypothetical protein